MKIVQINCTYNYGSTGKITRDLHNALKENGFESIVLYGRRQNSTQSDVVKTCSEVEAKSWNLISRFTGRPYAVSPIGTRNLIAVLKNETPDIIHLQCINGFFVDIYQLLDYLKQAKIPTVITLHAEFMYTGNCSYAFECNQWEKGCKKCPNKKKALKSLLFAPVAYNWNKMKESFEGFEELVLCPVSKWVYIRAQKSRILEQYNMRTIFNGIDTTIFSYDMQKAYKLKEKIKIGEKKIVLHVTADYNNPIKGGRYITELSQKLNQDKYCLIVVDGNDSPPPDDFNGIYWGRARNQEELATLYMIADVMTITSSRECLPTTCVESLCCGTPIVCFDFHNGFEESDFPIEYVKMVPFGKLEQLKKMIEVTAEESVDKEKISYDSKNIFSCENMTKNYLEVYQSLINSERI